MLALQEDYCDVEEYSDGLDASAVVSSGMYFLRIQRTVILFREIPLLLN